MPDALVIRRGRILDPASGTDQIGSVVIQGGFVRAWGDVDPGLSTQTIDAEGLWVCPGFVDLHVHLRDPGDEDEEDVSSGAKAASAGGYTAIVCMPNTRPPLDRGPAVSEFIHRARQMPWTRIHVAAALTQGLQGKTPTDPGALSLQGAIAFSDDGRCPQDPQVMERCMRSCLPYGPILEHAEDLSLSKGGVLHEGRVSRALGIRGIPSESETKIVARDLALAERTGARLHIQHVSCADTLDLIGEARSRGVAVSCEVTPHHLMLNEECASEGSPLFKVNPPLRTERDRQALVRGVVEGIVDCIATDHAPHRAAEKSCPLPEAAFGVIGMESSFQVCFTSLVAQGAIEPLHLVRLMSATPARLLGLPGGRLTPGSPADIVIIDPSVEGTIDPTRWQSRSRNCPFSGRVVKGQIVMTLVGGLIAFNRGVVKEEWDGV